jgi:hypothetical protein
MMPTLGANGDTIGFGAEFDGVLTGVSQPRFAKYKMVKAQMFLHKISL